MAMNDVTAVLVHGAWADGPGQNVITAVGYAARSLIADLHGFSLKERRTVLKAARCCGQR